jgi:hypothetical protein
VKRALWLLALAGCSDSVQPVQLAAARNPAAILAQVPPGHAARADVEKLVRQLDDLTKPNTGEGHHGPYHRAKDDVQERFWTAISILPAGTPEGDHLLFHGIDRVYTRYERNYWTGHHFHWPYLCSERAIRLCDKLLAEYPGSLLTERTLYLKAYALRLPSVEPDEDAEKDRTTYRLQLTWTPDYEKARAVYRDLLARFPNGRHARIAKVFAEQKELAIALPGDPDQPDPKQPLPLE